MRSQFKALLGASWSVCGLLAACSGCASTGVPTIRQPDTSLFGFVRLEREAGRGLHDLYLESQRRGVELAACLYGTTVRHSEVPDQPWELVVESVARANISWADSANISYDFPTCPERTGYLGKAHTHFSDNIYHSEIDLRSFWTNPKDLISLVVWSADKENVRFTWRLKHGLGGMVEYRLEAE